MRQNKSFYITTTLPYINAEPHLGHAMEFVRADIVARFQRLQGKEVFFNTGTDEHGLKVYRKVQEEGRNPQEYVDEYAEKFKTLLRDLNISYDHFSRTNSSLHKEAAQEFWKKCFKAGYIDKRQYKVKYCVGCELEKTDSELVNGKCHIHPHLKLELIDEENYFFKFSAFKKKLLKYYENNQNFVIPETRFNEIKRFIERGPEDFSISRQKSKMPWGIEVPDDSDHVMYVWFDALVNYISALGWPRDKEKLSKFWEKGETVQYAGKDNLRQQSAMWQAMLMSVGLPNTKQIVINGFILGKGGVKMSKSLGNVINPKELIDKYGADAFRYFVARELSTFEDSEFTTERFREAYNGNLANGLGNLVSRVMKLSEEYSVQTIIPNFVTDSHMKKAFNAFKLNDAMGFVWQKVHALDRHISETEPYKVIKTDQDKGKDLIQQLVREVSEIGYMLQPFMPSTSKKILEAIKNNKKPENLFPRKD